MHVISLKKLKQFWHSHPTAKVGLRYWYKLTITVRWQCFNDVCQAFPSADRVKNFVVFNIGGNNFRLITYIDYAQNKVFIRDVLTHGEYNKENWKKDDWYQ
jgi:mRNA interferase HigB